MPQARGFPLVASRGRPRARWFLTLSALAMAGLAGGCAPLDGEGAYDAPEDADGGVTAGDGDSAATLAFESADTAGPVGYVEPDYEGASFPLAEHDPRASYTLEPGTMLVDEFRAPPPGAAIEKGIIGGTDNRTAVADTTTKPARTVVMLIHRFPNDPANQKRLCSGTMVGSDAVLTNGHCVFDPVAQKWASEMLAVPAAYPDPAAPGKYKAPFGTSAGKKLFTHDSWRLGVGGEQKGHDFAIVRLNSALGVQTGTRAVGSASNPIGSNIEYYGYQGDLVLYKMYKSPGKALAWEFQEYGTFKTDADLYQGGSGSGLAASNNTTTVFGVMSREGGTVTNFGISFDIAKRDKVKSWVTAALP